MVGASAFEPEMAQVKVTFTTTEDGFQLPETKRQLLVPAGMALLSPLTMRIVRKDWLTGSLYTPRHKTSRLVPNPQLRVHAGHPPASSL